MNNILILSAGRRVELVEAFKAQAQKQLKGSLVITTDMRPELSAACRVADCSIAAPRATDEAYVDFLLDLCRDHEVGLVIPTIDTELLPLARRKADFARESINLIISSEDLVQRSRDKRRTAILFGEIGLPTPQIYARDQIRFPCFAKPYDGSCSIGARIVQSPGDVSPAMLVDEKLMFMELVPSTYKEFTVDAYFDRTGALLSLVPRQRLEVRGGEVSKGVTRKGYVYDFLLERLGRLRGALGCITLQVFGDETSGGIFAIEINPRFGGGYPLSYGAGANYPKWLIDEYLLGGKLSFYDAWKPNLLMLRYDAKVLLDEFD